jgi:multidrug resistance efflux pump
VTKLLFKLLRFVLIFALVGGFSYWLYGTLFHDQSFKGYVNGKIVKVRPPIRGKLSLKPMRVGLPVKMGDILGSIENERAYELLSFQQGLDQKVQVNQLALDSLDSQINNRQQWLSRFNQEAGQQTNLRVSYEKEQLTASEANVQQAKSGMEKAKNDAERYARLAEKGFSPKVVAEDFALRAKDSENNYKATMARFSAEKSRMAAAKVGMQVDGSLTKSYSESRRYDVETELYRLQNERERLLAEIKTATSQADQLNSPIQKMRSSKIITPVEGVVWNVNAYTNEYVGPEESVLEVLDCKNLWVDTYVKEAHLANLDLKAPVQISLMSHPELGTMKGTISLVRTGVGRVTVQEGVAVPNDKQKSQALIRMNVSWPTQPDPNNSCYVGTSIKAVFAKQPLSFKNPLQSVGILATIF